MKPLIENCYVWILKLNKIFNKTDSLLTLLVKKIGKVKLSYNLWRLCDEVLILLPRNQGIRCNLR